MAYKIEVKEALVKLGPAWHFVPSKYSPMYLLASFATIFAMKGMVAAQ